MTRLTLFAKGNLDVKDSLHSFRIGGQVLWNGINEIVRQRVAGTSMRVRHETWTRSDALLESNGTVPHELASRNLPLGAYPAEAQFSHALFTTDSNVFVLSIQSDVTTALLRHRSDGYLLYPSNWDSWSQADRDWAHREFAQAQLLDAKASMNNFEKIVSRIREHSNAPILIYNVSSVVPGESIHCHAGLGDIFSTRIRKFNVALAELSQKTGVSIIDVDAIVARAGADHMKLDTLHLTAEGYRRVAEEVVSVLDDVGLFPPGR